MKKIILVLLPFLMLACSLTEAPAVTTGNPTANPTITPRPTNRPQLAQPVFTVTIAPRICKVITGLDEGKLNLRSAPGDQSPIITQLDEGDTLTILDAPAVGDWIKITHNQLTGWINSTYCTKGQ